MRRQNLPWGTELGRYYGFPFCCIVEFGRHDRPEEFPLQGTGFIPCRKCMTKTAEELTEVIVKRRLCLKPFPNGSTEYRSDHYRGLLADGTLYKLVLEDMEQYYSGCTKLDREMDALLETPLPSIDFIALAAKAKRHSPQGTVRPYSGHDSLTSLCRKAALENDPVLQLDPWSPNLTQEEKDMIARRTQEDPAYLAALVKSPRGKFLEAMKKLPTDPTKWRVVQDMANDIANNLPQTDFMKAAMAEIKTPITPIESDTPWAMKVILTPGRVIIVTMDPTFTVETTDELSQKRARVVGEMVQARILDNATYTNDQIVCLIQDKIDFLFRDLRSFKGHQVSYSESEEIGDIPQ